MSLPVPKLRASAEAIAFTKKTMVFDCLSLYYALEDQYAERYLAAGVNVCNVTFGTHIDWGTMVANIESGLERIEKSSLLMLATKAADIEKAKAAGKLAVIMGTQGSAMVDDKLERIPLMHRLGLRIFGLAYTGATLLADGCGERRNGGLTFLGQEAVDVVNSLPLVLDLSHSGHQARADATARARAPVCTHSNSFSVNANDRNTTDETAKAIVAKGGMIGLCLLPKTVWPQNATLERVLDHCDYYRDLIGWQNIGLGCDFVEAYKAQGHILPESKRWRTYRPDIFGTVDEFVDQSYPEGFSMILELPNFTQALIDRGYSEEQVAGILGGNWFRHFKSVVG